MWESGHSSEEANHTSTERTCISASVRSHVAADALERPLSPTADASELHLLLGYRTNALAHIPVAFELVPTLGAACPIVLGGVVIFQAGIRSRGGHHRAQKDEEAQRVHRLLSCSLTRCWG